MKELKEVLIDTAHAKGICAEGYKQMLESSDIDAMVDYYSANPDWCLERDFPTLQTLSEKFSDYEDKGVFVNKTFNGELLNDLQTYIFHNCKGTIKVGLNVEKAIIPMLYFANGCELEIVGIGEVVLKKPSEVPVYIFGNNDISAKDNRFVKFITYNHDLI